MLHPALHSRPRARIVLGGAAACLMATTLVGSAAPLGAPVVAPISGQEPAQAAIDNFVDQGVEWLIARQQLDGSWNHGSGPRVGNTALILYTLLKSGVDPRHQAVQRAVLHLEREETQQTYDTALLIMALATHDPERHAGRIQTLCDRLVESQHGDWGYPGGADLSNTQYAALGLWAGVEAGARVPARTWDRLATATFGYQNPGGGFQYNTGHGLSSGSMTAAGVGVLAICRQEIDPERKRPSRIDRAIERGLQWLDDNFTVRSNPGRGTTHLGYYLYGLERVGALVPTDRIGEHDWYRETAAFLVGGQARNGQARNGRGSGRLGGGTVQTCFALLFLRKATAPVTGDLRASGGRRYTQRDPDLDVRITAAGDNPLSMWIVGYGREVRRANEWPAESGQGPHVVRVIWYVDDVEVARLAGSSDEPVQHERFAHRQELSLPGVHGVSAEVHILRPPSVDRHGRSLPATVRVLRSETLEVNVEHACAEWMLENARDRSRNLVPGAWPTAFSSSTLRGHPPGLVTDNLQGTSWLAARDDPRPSLRLEFDQAVEANLIVVGHARQTPHVPSRWARALEVEITINGTQHHRLRMHADEQRKARLELPQAVKIETLEFVIPMAAPGSNGERAVGLAEVELQLR